MTISLTALSVIYSSFGILMLYSSGILLWRSRKLSKWSSLLSFTCAVLATMAVIMALLWIEESAIGQWQAFARFWLISVIAWLAFPLFGLLYHLPTWEAAQRREFRVVLTLMSIRLLLELYWSVFRSMTLMQTGMFIERRPVFLDVLLGAALFWLIVVLIRRTRRFQQRFGLFITEALLLGLLPIPTVLAQLAYSSYLISYATYMLVRDSMIMLIMPLIVLVLLDLLSEVLDLLTRLLILSLLMMTTMIGVIGLLSSRLIPTTQTMHIFMLNLSGLVIVSSCLIIIGVPYILKRSVFRPLRAVLKAVHQVNKGDLSVHVPVTFSDEIGQLTHAFNHMVAELRSTVQGLEHRVQERTAALGQSEARYRGLVEQIDEVLFRIRLPNLELDYISPSIERMLGYPLCQILGTPLFLQELVHPEDRARTRQYAEELGQQQLAASYEFRVIDAQGQARRLQQSNTGIYQDGQLIAVEGIWRDITAAYNAEQLLLTQQRELAALHERERIGRDLHDNLGQVMGYVNLQTQSANRLIDSGQVHEAQAILGKLTSTAQEAHSHIRSYILALRLPEPAPLSGSWKQHLQHTFQSFEQRYALQIRLIYAPELPEDPFPMHTGKEILQIILEALNNIHKHAGSNRAEICLAAQRDGVLISIKDHGAGFNTFALSAAQSGQTSGMSGLGLTMMQERAALINAELSIHSTLSLGTEVLLQVPVNLIPAQVQQLQRPSSLAGLRVLLVDDHPLFIEGLATMLNMHGLQVVGVAQNGLEAQELAQQLKPDIILMDMHMPQCNGPQAAAAIKLLLPSTKIIMLTVAAEEEHLLMALKAGASGYLLKNLNSEAFFALLSEAIHGELVLSPELATQALQELTHPKPEKQIVRVPPQANNDSKPRLLLLTPRQRDILERVAAGQTYKEVAAALFITEPTIKYHMSQIIELLQVKGRREAIALAREPDST